MIEEEKKMAERMVLDAEIRELTGSNYVKNIRKTGKVPAVFYTHGEEPIVLTLDEANLRDLLLHGAKLNDIVIDKQEARRFVFREIQYHPVTENVLHVDIMGVRRDEVIQIDVPISLVGEAEGVKVGGILEHLLHMATISCKAEEIPENIEVDISALEMGDTMTIADIKTGNFEFVTPENYAIATVSVPKEEEEPEVEEDLEEGDEGVETEESAEGGAETGDTES